MTPKRNLPWRRWHRTHWKISFTTAILGLLVGGCVLPAVPLDKMPVQKRPTHDQTNSTPVASSPTEVWVAADAVTPNPLPDLPTPLPEPLLFTFPTVAPESVSGWRPPLYPVPWEPTPQDHFYFIRPIGANEVNWPLARYRYGGVFFANTVHTGVDIPAPKGTPVLAAGPGEVVWAGYGLFFLREELGDPYGLAIAIKHDFGYEGQPIYTVYGHMDEIFAFRGQRVETGQVIGLVGETGKVTGPHLHFEVRLEDNKAYGSRNPELWMAPPKGWGVLVGRAMGEEGGPLYKQTINLRHIESNQYWFVITYDKGGVNPDEYYNENAVIGDLPAGEYRLWIVHKETTYSNTFEIRPGQVTYFEFWGRYGFFFDRPETPEPAFTPPDGIPIQTATP